MNRDDCDPRRNFYKDMYKFIKNFVKKEKNKDKKKSSNAHWILEQRVYRKV